MSALPKPQKANRFLLTLVLIMTGIGFLMFTSAAMGTLSHNIHIFNLLVSKQFIILIFGLCLMVVTSHIPYPKWRQWALYFFGFGLLATLAVWVPSLGSTLGGANRWLNIAGFSFQPAEILKIAYVIYLAGWLASVKDNIEEIKASIIPAVIITALTIGVLALQPDYGTILVITVSGGAILLASRARYFHLFVLGFIGLLIITTMAWQSTYIQYRIQTFLNPGENLQTTGYQIDQSIIAIGSGGLTGRGFGQSLQKFEFLPQPIADSIFAVVAEEFGFIGSFILIFLYAMLACIGIKIASKAKDDFGRLLAIGIVILIVSQSFINIGAMIGLLPLSGLPLIFVSHGGTALLLSLMSIGILLNISKYQKK
ncbi:MAG: FtsW/RodA/SpoVE family cell cycle protein [Patescibacteria group bacterium]